MNINITNEYKHLYILIIYAQIVMNINKAVEINTKI